MAGIIFIKKCDSALLAQIIALYDAQGWHSPSDKPARYRAMIEGSHCFVAALENGRVVGMGRAISDRANDAYIQDVAVLKEFRGRGIASKIVRALSRRLSADGIKWAGLIAAGGTHKFYAGNGFKVMKTAKPMVWKKL